MFWVFEDRKAEWNKQTDRFYAIAVMSISRKFSIKVGGFTLKGTQVLSDSFLRYENYDFENFTMQNYIILATSLAVNFCLQTSKTI